MYTTGRDIDIRARTPLWQNGWNYNHGTGHGIGYWLNVHEGSPKILPVISLCSHYFAITLQLFDPIPVAVMQ